MKKDSQTIDISNVRWFHPGLGKTQRKIMDILEKLKGDNITLKPLVYQVYHPELDLSEMKSSGEYPVTRSQLNSVRRAVKILKKRGLVWKEILRTPDCYPLTFVGLIETNVIRKETQ